MDIRIASLNLDIIKAEQEQSQRRIKEWRLRMQNVKNLGAWIRSKENSGQAASVYDGDGRAASRQEVTEKMFNYWFRVENRTPLDPDSTAQFLAENFGQTNPLTLPPAFQSLWQQVRQAKSSAGPDGWNGEELKYLPVAAIQIWAKLSESWLHFGATPRPRQFRQIRQVRLPKANKIDENHNLHITGIRPVSVCSCSWRIWSSSSVKSEPVSTWAQEHLDPSICFGQGSLGAEAAASVLQDQFAQGPGFIGTLDFQEAFDRMSPVIAKEFLLRLQWPPGLVHCLFSVGGHQCRFLQFEGHVHLRPLLAQHMAPQGCPWAPLILGLWLSSGSKYVQRQMTTLPSKLVIYMDDRSFTCRTWSTCEEFIQSWNQWSNVTGFTENTRKTQIAARGPGAVQQLNDHCPADWIRKDIDVLGVTTVSKPRTDSVKEENRIRRTFQRAALLLSVGLSWPLLLASYKTFILSLISYGWVGRKPTDQLAKVLFSWMTKASGTGRNASVLLRKVLYGAVADLRCAHVTRSWKRLRKRMQSGTAPPWNNKCHTSVYLLRKQLADLGWLETSPWSWTRPDWGNSVNADNRNLCLGPNSHQPVELQLRNIRLSYKHARFDEFIESSRREARAILGLIPVGALVVL